MRKVQIFPKDVNHTPLGFSALVNALVNEMSNEGQRHRELHHQALVSQEEYSY